MKKWKIEKNSVQETLIIPLYYRKLCAEKYPELFRDRSAKELCERLDYDFSELEAKKESFSFQFGALEVAMRQLDMMWEIEDYLKAYPQATIVNLGCGLDQTGRVCDNGSCRIVNIDLPDIIAVRNQLLPAGEREKNLACDLLDESWMEGIDGSQGVVFFAAGVFYYLKREEVKNLVIKMAKRFPGGRLVFDSANKLGLKLMMAKILKKMGMKDVGAFFYINYPSKELRNWARRIKVSHRPYLTGYYELKHKDIDIRHKLLANIGDYFIKMSIMRMEFERREV